MASGKSLEDITQGIRRLARLQHRTPAQSAEFASLCRQSKVMNESMRAINFRSADPAVRRSAMGSRREVARDIEREKRTAAKAQTPTPVRTAPAPSRSYRDKDARLAAITAAGIADDTSRVSPTLLRDLALRDLSTRNELSTATQDRLDGLLRNRSPEVDPGLLARHVIVTGRSAYRSAWLKTLTTTTAAFTPAEREAITDYVDHLGALDRHAAAESSRLFAERAAHGDTRAMSESSGSAGLGVPWYLDPSIVVVAGGVESAQLLSVAKSVLSTSDNYHAFTAASTGFATQAEAATVADNTPTFGGVDIPIWTAFGQDQPGWADNATELFRNAYGEFVSQKTATGPGGTDVTGVFTALTNSTASPAHCVVTTAGTIGAVDVRAAWTALPERYRVDPSCSWLMSPSVEQKIAALSAPSVVDGLGPQDLTTDPGSGQRRLFGRPILSVANAPAFIGTSGSANYAVVGAFDRYYVATRIGGYSVELVPLLRDPSTGRPNGERGFLATARVGGDVADPNAFRILSNS
jgi:hypothetical protein